MTVETPPQEADLSTRDTRHFDLQDRIYRSQNSHIAPFAFDEQVVPVFQDMIQRSVPGYIATVDLALLIAQQVLKNGDRVYDLGCSLGAISLALFQQQSLPSIHIEAIDSSQAMVDTLNSIVKDLSQSKNTIQVEQNDIRKSSLKNSKFCLLNFVLQFIAQEDRAALLEKIYQSLAPEGVLMLSEKIVFENQAQQATLNDLHLNFKRLHGYSDLEIHNKRTALENVLIPETFQAHKDRLLKAGFRQVFVALQHLNFISLIAIK